MKLKFEKNNSYMLFCLILFLYIDLARGFNKEIYILILYKISNLIFIENLKIIKLIFFFVLFLICIIIDSITKVDLKNSLFLFSSKQTIVSFLSLFIIVFTLEKKMFSLSYLLPLFITFFCFILLKNYKKFKKIFSPKALIFIFIISNFLLMSINLKSDSKLFESFFNKNRFIISSWTRTLNNTGINYFAINCCSSENYIESGLKPGGFLNLWQKNLIITNSKGIFYSFPIDKIESRFTHTNNLESNFYDFVNKDKFTDINKLSIRGVEIDDNKIYVSYINEVYENCYNLSVLEGDIFENKITFSKFFNPLDCIFILDILNSELHSSGGAMIVESSNLYLSIGEFDKATLAQEVTSLFGKIVKIDKKNKSYKVVSIGHRNIQGMIMHNSEIYFTEHGPKGGDEVNKLELSSDSINNYGWPISSYGEHYDGKFYEDMPLFKSHKDFGYIEPIFYFTPSIGISDLKIFKDTFVISSMKSGRLYIIKNDESGNMFNNYHIDIGHRIRDFIIFENKIIMFLEDLSGIAIKNI